MGYITLTESYAMKILYITALKNIKVSGEFGRGLVLGDTGFFTNDRTIVNGLLTQLFIRTIGTLEYNYLINSQAVIYSIRDIPDINSSEEGIKYLNYNLALTQQFLMCLWLVKDNSVNCDIGFLEYPYKGARPQISNNSRSAYFSNSSLKFEEVSFDREEIKKARDIYSNQISKRPPDTQVSGMDFLVLKDSTRMQRVWYFTQGARASPDLGIKISNYMTCFESLFSTDPSELSHKLSERVACFLGLTPAEKHEIYNDIKVAYKIRSKTVHGDRISKPSVAEIASISSRCDDLLRKAINKIWADQNLFNLFSGSHEKIEDYMLKILFGNK